MDDLTISFVSVHHIKGLEVTSSSYNKVLEENRFLYNQVQDLKGVSPYPNLINYPVYILWYFMIPSLIERVFLFTGTIRVYCRVRPFLGQSNGQSSVDYIGENGTIMIVNPLKQGKDSRRVFTFNKVFRTNVTQGK